ncbi:TonB-dependent receptor [Brevundimonas staleyi]|uniref:TonB-dependent receptor n=1 Tax=Brevundimonas staleyi TaxID=74326 RepID=A0ABW0FUV2_9CAUL
MYSHGMWVSAAALMSATTVLVAGPAASAQAEIDFVIPSGPLEAGLRLLAEQSGERVLYDAALVSGRSAPAVSGRMTTDAAIARLLAGSGLRPERTAANVLIVRAERAAGSDAASVLDEVVVTGSLIRGISDGPSPVVVVSRDELDRDGRASVAEALAALPQAFGGTGNEETTQNGADRSATNGAFSSGINLRGLGADATLVLVNGRRIAGSGAKGDLADVSGIPTNAVDRIEVLLDGASALYGSDAVGGVVNIILNRRFDGAETRLRLGQTTDGPAGEYGVAQSVGRRWSGGGGFLSWDYLQREALPASARAQAATADLSGLGGTDRRTIYGAPGNLVRFDAATQSLVPTFAIRPRSGSSAVSAADFVAGAVNLQNQRSGVNVLPRQTRDGVYAAFDQALGDRLVVTGDVRYGDRRYETTAAPSLSLITVDGRNPFYVSPTGAASHQIAYSFAGDLGNPALSGRAESLGLSLGGEYRLGGDWVLDAYVAYAEAQDSGRITNQVNTARLREALGTAADSPLTPFSPARDGFFNPFGDGSANTTTVLDFVGGGYSANRYETESRSLTLQADGSLFDLPAGAVRLALGGTVRIEAFQTAFTNFTSALTETVRVSAPSDRQIDAVFAEARVPLFGGNLRRPGLERLELSLAVRAERYDDIGSTTNPKLGILWSPASDWIVRGGYGTSFRAPALREVNDPASAGPTLLPGPTGQTVTLIQYGGNPGLDPETARSWTAGLEYRPRDRPEVGVSLNWFRTRFEDRIGQPAAESILTVLSDPALVSFVRRISPSTDAGDRALIQGLLDLPTTASATAFPAEAYGAIVDARYVNTAEVEIEGLDLSGRYGFSTGADLWRLGASVSHLLRYDTQATPTAPVVDVLDRPNFPLSWRGRITGDWIRGAWSARLAADLTNGYEDLAGRAIDGWITTDAQIRYAPEGPGPWAGVTVALSVQNLFDADPPFYDAPEGIGYDAANASLLGRFVSLQVTRRW